MAFVPVPAPQQRSPLPSNCRRARCQRRPAQNPVGDQGRVTVPSTPGPSNTSPVEWRQFRGHRFMVKRDDKLPAQVCAGLTGNKARKLLALHRQLVEKPPCPPNRVAYVLSYGGVQSNSMLALAKLCAAHPGAVLLYATREAPPMLRAEPTGNFKLALDLGMKHIQLDAQDFLDITSDPTRLTADGLLLAMKMQNRIPSSSRLLLVPMGAAYQDAQLGLRVLADEIQRDIDSDPECQASVNLVVAAGTGTTSFFLANLLDHRPDIRVWAAPVATNSDTLRDDLEKMQLYMEARYGRPYKLPDTIASSRKRPFAALSREMLANFYELEAAGMRPDIIYAPRAWELLVESPFALLGSPKSTLLYYHCGGQEGNSSQLARYQEKFPYLF